MRRHDVHSALAPQSLLRLSDPSLLLLDHGFSLTMTVAPAVDMVDLHRIRSLFCRLGELRSRRCAASRLTRLYAIHHTSCATGSQLVDSTDSVNSSMKCTSGIEILLDCGQQVLLTLSFTGTQVSDPRMRQGFVRGHARCWIDCQAATNEFTSSEGNAAPVFEGSKRVVGDEDSLHLLKVRVAIEGCVAAEKEVSDDADSPDVAASY